MVGDDAQAIYSFRAAAVENILGFPDRFRPKAEVDHARAELPLEPERARCGQRAHGGCAAPIPQAPAVDAWPGPAPEAGHRRRSADAGRIHLHAHPRRRAKPAFRSSARPCCSARGSHSDVLEIELAKRKIPFVKYGGLKFLEAAHVKDLLAVLRWADNPRNQLAAFRVLQFMPGMGPANAKRALDHFVANNYLWTLVREVRAADRCARWRGRNSSICSPRSASRIANGVARSTWCASGTSRTWSACTTTCTRASAISTSSSCCRRNTRRASDSSPSSRSIRRTPRSDLAGQADAWTRTTWSSPPFTPPRAWSGTTSTS